MFFFGHKDLVGPVDVRVPPVGHGQIEEIPEDGGVRALPVAWRGLQPVEDEQGRGGSEGQQGLQFRQAEGLEEANHHHGSGCGEGLPDGMDIIEWYAELLLVYFL